MRGIDTWSDLMVVVGWRGARSGGQNARGRARWSYCRGSEAHCEIGGVHFAHESSISQIKRMILEKVWLAWH